MVTKYVKDLYVNCSLQVRNFDKQGVTMSDCCGRHATSAVLMEDDAKMWRCREHAGIRVLRTGQILLAVEINDNYYKEGY